MYDYLNRLRAIGSAPSGASPLSYGYTYNNANQRVQVTLISDASFQVQVQHAGEIGVNESTEALADASCGFELFQPPDQILIGGTAAGLVSVVSVMQQSWANETLAPIRMSQQPYQEAQSRT